VVDCSRSSLLVRPPVFPQDAPTSKNGTAMTPQQFIAKWKDNPLGERASYQMHFADL
jgi:hypothetical protein